MKLIYLILFGLLIVGSCGIKSTEADLGKEGLNIYLLSFNETSDEFIKSFATIDEIKDVSDNNKITIGATNHKINIKNESNESFKKGLVKTFNYLNKTNTKHDFIKNKINIL